MENQVKKMENNNGSKSLLDKKIELTSKDFVWIITLVFTFGSTWMTITSTNNRQDQEIQSIKEDRAKDIRERSDNYKQTVEMLSSMQKEMVEMKLKLREIETKLSK